MADSSFFSPSFPLNSGPPHSGSYERFWIRQICWSVSVGIFDCTLLSIVSEMVQRLLPMAIGIKKRRREWMSCITVNLFRFYEINYWLSWKIEFGFLAMLYSITGSIFKSFKIYLQYVLICNVYEFIYGQILIIRNATLGSCRINFLKRRNKLM